MYRKIGTATKYNAEMINLKCLRLHQQKNLSGPMGLANTVHVQTVFNSSMPTGCKTAEVNLHKQSFRDPFQQADCIIAAN